MAAGDLKSLAVLIRRNREPLLTKWRSQVRELPSARKLDAPTLTDHIPRLLDELADALKAGSDETIAEALCEGSPPEHGLQRVQDAFDITEVVAEYNILRGCIHDLADSNGLSLQGEAFHVLNLVLDRAIGLAVDTYATHQALEVQHRREEYLAFVAHDLRTPLNAIFLATKVLELAFPPQSRTPESTQSINSLGRNVRQLEAMVEKILEESSSLQTEIGLKLQRRYFDLWPLVQSLIQDVHPIAGTSSTLLLNEVPEDQVVFADASLLRRVFQNLIANAIEYTPRGEIRIGARDDQASGAVECWVADNGAGIPEARLGTVFDKGVGDDKKDDSRGLGLAIVKTFVDAHEGTIRAESTGGHGSTIRLWLPSKPSIETERRAL